MTYDCSLKQVGDAYFMEIGCISRNDENTRKHSLKMSVDKKRKMATILVLASDGKEVSRIKKGRRGVGVTKCFLGLVENSHKF